jgi:hypothetical protein
VVSQAQKELSKLTTEAPRELSPGENTTDTEDSTRAGPSQSATPTASTSAERELSSSSLLARLQSALPPNIMSTVQNTIPETLKHATENIDLSQLRTTLTNEFQRVQDATIAQAGEYVHRSEGLLREAMKEAGDVLRDAVKVIPPEEVEPAPGVAWDGADVWMIPSSTGELSDGGGKGKGKESAPSSGLPSGEAQRSVATRAESLLRQLKQNPGIIRHDPETDARSKEIYHFWLKVEVEAKKGGVGSDEWTAMVDGALNEPVDGQALQASLDSLGESICGCIPMPDCSL